MAVERVLVEKHVTVTLRDGVETRGDLYRPAEGPPVPGIVCRTPYDKEAIGATRVLPSPLKFAEAGYAVLVVDVRGRYSSDGAFAPFHNEGRDGYDTVEWMAAQPSCNGEVGIFGLSYYGATTLLATRERPPSLRCAVAAITASDYFDDWTHYGGALQLGFSGTWGMGLAAAQLLREDHGIPEEHAQALALAMASPLQTLRHRPLSELPGMSLPGVAPFWAEWLEHDRRDEHWEALRLSRDYTDFQVPVMHVGGWFDLFTLGTVRNFQGMHAAGVAPQRLWMGPWSHTSYERYHGDVDFGGTAPVGLCGIADAYLAFFDEYLREQSPEEPQPTVRYFLMGQNEWRDASAWPPPEARRSRSTCAPAAGRTARAATAASMTGRPRATSRPIATSSTPSGPCRPRAARCSSSRSGSPARASSPRSRRATTCSATRPRRSSSR